MALLRRGRKAGDYCQEALRLSRAGNPAGALAAADRAIKIAPGLALAHHLRGGALSDLGHHFEALIDFRQAIALDPAMTYVQYRIAFELSFIGRNADALVAVDEALRLEPDDIAPVILRGAILSDLGRGEEALASFTSVLQREPDLGQVHYNRARVLRRLGRYPEAVAGYDEALRLAPQLPDIYEQKGIALAMAGQYDRALAEFARSPATVAGRPAGTAYAWSAAIAWHRGNPREAHRLFTLAADQPLGMNHRESADLEAVVSCALGHPDAAADLLKAHTSMDPGDQAELSRLYDLLGDPPLPGIGRLRAVAFGSSGP